VEEDKALETRVVAKDGSASLIVRGEIDIAAVHDLAKAIADALDRRLPSLVIDLSGVTFCDSSGLGQFAHTAQDCATRGIGLRIVGTTPSVRRVFEVTGMVDLLEG
jgi:anti-sigma B factor antagonist